MAGIYRDVRSHDRAAGRRLPHRRCILVLRRDVRHRVQVRRMCVQRLLKRFTRRTDRVDHLQMIEWIIYR